MKQAPGFDSLSFYPFSLLQDGLTAPEVDVGRGEVLQALVIAPMVVMLDEGVDLLPGVDRTWGSCGAFSVCDGRPTIENCGPCDGYSVSPFGRPPHPSALSHAGIGNVID